MSLTTVLLGTTLTRTIKPHKRLLGSNHLPFLKSMLYTHTHTHTHTHTPLEEKIVIAPGILMFLSLNLSQKSATLKSMLHTHLEEDLGKCSCHSTVNQKSATLNLLSFVLSITEMIGPARIICTRNIRNNFDEDCEYGILSQVTQVAGEHCSTYLCSLEWHNSLMVMGSGMLDRIA